MLSVATPLGNIQVFASNQGVCRIELPDSGDSPAPGRIADSELEQRAARQLEEYFAGRRRQFDLPLDLRAEGFLRRVLLALRDIPYGQTRSYGAVAREVGSPGAARAVGGACRRNPLPLLIPCHRVIGKSGALVGFAGQRRALGVKEQLLALERTH